MSEVQIRTSFVLEGLQALLSEARRFGGEVAAELGRSSQQVKQSASGIQYFVDAAGRARDASGRFISAAELAAAGVQKVGDLAQYAGRKLDMMDAAVMGVAASLTGTLTNALGAAAAGLKGMVGDYLQLDTQIRLAAAAAGEQGGYERLAKVIDKVGIDAAGTTLQVSQMATSLVRAGFSLSEVEKSLPGIVRGAEATGTAYETMGNIVGNTLRGFALETKETARVVDVLVKTANGSNASIEGLGYTMQYAAPVAKSLGISLEEVAAAAGLMANAGIDGSTAGTGLRFGLPRLQMAAAGASGELLGLQRGQEHLVKSMKVLGESIVGPTGKLLNMKDVFLKLKEGFAKFGATQQVEIAKAIFGDDAGSKFLAILNQSEKSIRSMFDAIKSNKGATDEAFKAQQGPQQEINRLTGTLNSLGTTMGGVIMGALLPGVKALNAVAGAVSGLPGPIKIGVASLVALYAAVVTAQVGLLALNRTLMFVTGAETARAAWTMVAATLSGPVVQGAAAARNAVAGLMAGIAAETAGVGTLTAVLGAGLLGLAAAIALGAVAWAGFNALTNDGKKELAEATKSAEKLKQEINRKSELGLDTTAAKMKLVNLEKQIAELKKKAAEGSIIDQVKGGIDVVGEANKLGRGAGVVGNLLGITRTGGAEIVGQLQAVAKQYGLTAEQARALYYDALAISKIKNPETATYGEIAKAMEKLPELAEKWTGKMVTGSKAATDAAVKIPKTTIESLKSALQEAQTAVGKIDINDKDGLAKAEAKVTALQRQIASIEQSAKLAAANMGDATLNTLRMALQAAQEAVSNVPVGDTSRMRAAQEEVRRLQKQVNDAELTDLERQQKLHERLFNQATQELEVAKQQLSVENQRNGLISTRIQLQQQVMDAISNRAQAQEGLVRSEFDLVKARGGYELQQAEAHLQVMKQAGATSENIGIQERYIAELKAQARQVEINAMAAEIAAAQNRFQIETAMLQLKQRGQLLEAQSAVRSSRMQELEAAGKLLSLRQQLADLNAKGDATPEQLNAMNQQIALQQQVIGLNRMQTTEAQNKVQALGTIFGLEQQTLGLQQQAQANGLQSKAAAQGFEQALSGSLTSLQDAAGNGLQLSDSLRSSETAAQAVLGYISAGAETIRLYGDLPAPMYEAADAAASMANGLATAQANAVGLLATMQAIAATPKARWAGGGVSAGERYQVNELGQESLLHNGRLSLIRAGRSAMWTAPTSGVVLPAGITAELASQGMIEGASNIRRSAGGTMTAGQVARTGGGVIGRQIARLAAATGRLEQRMSELVAKRWDVTVAMPSNAGALRLSQAYS